LRYRRKPTLAKVNATVLRFEIQLTHKKAATPIEAAALVCAG
jgi:hypothetical protein